MCEMTQCPAPVVYRSSRPDNPGSQPTPRNDGGISNDKSAAAHGPPTQIAEVPDCNAAIAGLKRLGLIVEDDTPVIDAEVVPSLQIKNGSVD
jgi:hypothetical protein